MITGCGNKVLDPTAQESRKVLSECGDEATATTYDMMNKLKVSTVAQLSQKDQLKLFWKINESYDDCVSDKGFSIEKTLKEYLEGGLSDYEKAYAIQLMGTYIMMVDNLQIPETEMLSAGIYTQDELNVFHEIAGQLRN